MDKVSKAARAAPIVPYAAYAPQGSESSLKRHLAPGTALVLADGSISAPDGVRGFGRCLFHAVEGMLAHGHSAACVLSSDVPTLPARILVETATTLLAGGDRGVFGACHDGGYYLLGLKHAYAHLFVDIAWSTDGVADATRKRASEIGLELVELEPWYDVDDAAALSRLLGDTRGDAAPATRAVLEQLGLRADEAP